MTNEQRVIQLAVHDFGLDESELSNSKHRLLKDLGVGSLDILDLTMNIEDEFDIEISDEDADEFTTLQKVIDYIDKAVK